MTKAEVEGNECIISYCVSIYMSISVKGILFGMEILLLDTFYAYK